MILTKLVFKQATLLSVVLEIIHGGDLLNPRLFSALERPEDRETKIA